MRLALASLALAPVLALTACTTDNTNSAGLAQNVLVTSWNLSRFPLTDESPSVIGGLISQRQLDLVAVQEIRNEAALNQLVQGAPGYAGVLEPASGTVLEQRVGFLWRTSRLLVEDSEVLFATDPDFPKPPLLAKVRRIGAGDPVPAFTAIVLQLRQGTSTEEMTMRQNAVQKLETYVRNLVAAGEAEVIVLGDFASAPTDASGPTIMAPFTSSADYDVPTFMPSSPFTYIPDKTAVDQILHTKALREERGSEKPTVERMDQTVTGYDMRVSDHLPVVLRFPFIKR